MPELPEVEVTRRELAPVLRGAHIGRVVLRRAGLRRPFPPLFDTRLAGAVVKRLRRRAKYLVADLSSGDSLIMHLGMSGSFRIEPAEHVPEAHDHVVFDLSSGRSRRVQRSPPIWRDGSSADLGVYNVRRCSSGSVRSRYRPDSTPTCSPMRAARSRRPLKVALLDQRVVAGLGNIYASEALHVARLSPRRRAGSIATRNGAPRPEAHRLVAAIKHVLTKAIDWQIGGRIRGREFRVYERESGSCPRRSCPGLIRRITQAGRSTFFCAVCQQA